MAININAAMSTALAADVVHHVLLIRVATTGATQRWVTLPWSINADVDDGSGPLNYNGLGAIEQVDEIQLASSLGSGRFSFLVGVVDDVTLLNLLLAGLKDAQIYRGVYVRATNSIANYPICFIDGHAHLGQIRRTGETHVAEVVVTSKTHVLSTMAIPSRTHDDQLRRGAELGEAGDDFLIDAATQAQVDLSRPNFIIKSKSGLG